MAPVKRSPQSLMAIAAVLVVLLAGLGWWLKGHGRSASKGGGDDGEETSDSVHPSPTPVATAPAAAVPKLKLTLEATRQFLILNEILASHNDNDPRLDADLRVLDETAKNAFRAKYHTIPPERRNDRGTIVFLLGRNLTKPRDYEFFKSVLSEPPCLSLKDCGRAADAKGNLGEDDAHHSGSIAIVLAYPQLTALQAMEKHPPAKPSLNAPAREVIEAARASRMAIVAKFAEKFPR